MISLRKSIENFDYRVMFEAAIGSYRSALESLEQNTIRVEYDGIAEYRKTLQNLQSRLNPQALRPESLRSHAADLNSELLRNRSDLESLLKEAGNDLKEVVAALADTAETLSHREQIHGSQLSRLSGSLEAISHLDDLPQLRGKLSQHVVELRSCIEQMSRENESAVQTLQQELVGFQKKLEKVQIEASTDPLTGIANRRRAAKEIAQRMREKRTFGVLLLDLNKFKVINDTHGHNVGDSVLQIVAQRLSVQARKEDLVCRWGGDEFVVIRDGNSMELEERGKELAKRIAGRISINTEGQTHDIVIGAEVGWAEYRDGETIEQLLAKADKSLYETKSPRSAIIDSGMERGTNQLVAKSQREPDACTGLAGIEELEEQIQQRGSELGLWSVACFAIRHPAAIDSHYGYPATEQVLPFLRDEIRATNLGKLLFRGRGTSLFALVRTEEVNVEFEREVRRIAAIGFEKVLQQKRRQSVRSIAACGSVVPLDLRRGMSGAMQDLDRFMNLHKADEKLATSVMKD